MDVSQELKTLLQVHLASDSSAALHLPHVLATLSSTALRSSEHIQKWVARVNSLIVSRDGAARWAGLCIALQTASLSRDLMLECAQTWVGATIPLLSSIKKNEAVPTTKVAIRLMRRVFTSAMDVPEYQRQVCTPNVPKFSTSLVALGEKTSDVELKVLVFQTLAHLVSLYPNLHRAAQTSLMNFAMAYLNGSAPHSLPLSVVNAASQFYSVMHHTGGKVGAASQWRKSVDDSLSFCWGALSSLRTTFAADNSGISSVAVQGDPVIGIPLNVDRLRVGVQVLCDLLQSSNLRPVVLPVGQIVKLCVAMLRCTTTDITDGHVDPLIRSLEVSVTPRIHEVGCSLLNALIGCARHLLLPHYSLLLFYIVHHLEQRYEASHRLLFLRTTHSLTSICGPHHDTILPSRLARAVLPSLTSILASRSSLQEESVGAAKNRKGKKRARGYEGDEVFQMTKSMMCTSEEDGDVLLAALDVIRILLRSGPVSPPVHSLATRVVLSLQLTLPQMPASVLSADAALHEKVRRAVSAVCAGLASGTTSIMSKSLGLVIGTSVQNATSQNIFNDFDLLLHPRVPPLVRSLPHVEMLSLFRAEEGQEELETRQFLHLGAHHELPDPLADANGSSTPAKSTPAALSTLSQPKNLRPTTEATMSSSAIGAATEKEHETSQNTFQVEKSMPSPRDPPRSSLAAVSWPSESLLSSQATTVTASSSTQSPRLTNQQPAAVDALADVMMVPEDEEDEDEPMPSIDVESDSDESGV